jgi:hypothetical protein
MKAKTYDEWKELGYQVIRGEKASSWNAQGKATFTRDQVEDADSLDYNKPVDEIYREE